MDEKKPTCGNCAHWERRKPYLWGICRCPIPAYIAEIALPDGPIFRDDLMASDCECYQARRVAEMEVER